MREGKWQESGQTAYCGESKYVPKKEAEVSMPSPDHPLPATVLQVLQFVLALSTIEYNCYGMMTNTNAFKYHNDLYGDKNEHCAANYRV